MNDQKLCTPGIEAVNSDLDAIDDRANFTD